MKNNKGIIGFVVCCLVILSFQQACGERSSEEVNAQIAGSEKLQHIDLICKELAKPDSFRFAKKKTLGNAVTSMIIYQYTSDMSFRDVNAFYEDSTNLKGYVLVHQYYKEPEGVRSEIRFQRDDVAIVTG